MEKHVSRFVNLKSTLDIINSGNKSLISSFLNTYDNSFPKKKNKKRNVMDEDELEDFTKLVKLIISNSNDDSIYDGYLLNYTFYNGVREEFDILRFGETQNLNIELKSKKNPEDIKEQLLRHKHLLTLLKKDSMNKQQPVKLFTYVSSTNKLWKLTDNDQLVITNIEDLINCIDKNWLRKNPLNDLDLTSMIISPYSEPVDFVEHNYFLTDNQSQTVKKIINYDKNGICLTGGPGSGKTLVLFDVAKKESSNGKSVIFILCSQLNNEICQQLKDIFKFDIMPIKRAIPYSNNDEQNYEFLKQYDVIIVDEAQRIYENQLNCILKMKNQKKIFSCDQKQTLHSIEEKLNVTKKLSDNGLKTFNLSKKIRSNPAMSSFIQKLLNKKANKIQPFDFENVDAVYFDDIDEAKKYMETMKNEDNFKIIEPTPYKTKSSGIEKRKKIMESSISTHESIGKEYDNVLIPMDKNYEYDENDKLTSIYSQWYPYNEESLLFEALTRVRKRLLIVVINNPNLFEKILKILSWKSDCLQKKNNL